MYSIIYWEIQDNGKTIKRSDNPYPLLNDNGTIWTTDDLRTADARANDIDLNVPMIQGRKVDGCRVISIEAVNK